MISPVLLLSGLLLGALPADAAADRVAEAMALRARGDLVEAVETVGAGLDAERPAEEDAWLREVTERILGELYDDDPEAYDRVIADFEGRRLAALARLRQASLLVWTRDRLDTACPLLADVERRSPGTEEAHRAMIARATRCSDTFDGPDEPEHLLDKVAQEERGTIWGAYALYQLGKLRAWRQERRLAREAFERLREDYPRDFEMPRGVSLVGRAEEALAAPDYVLTPLLDRIAWRIRQALGYEERYLSAPAPFRVAVSVEAVLAYVARIVPLIAILLAAGAFFRPRPEESRASFRRWTLPSVGTFLAAYWSIPMLLILWDALAPPTSPLLAWLVGRGWLFLGPLLLLALILRGESVPRLFGLDAMQATWRWATSLAAVGMLCYSYYVSSVLPTVLTFVAILAEETLYRGLLLRVFDRRMPFLAAAAVSAAVFAVMPVEPAPEMARLFALGFGLCYVRRWSDGLTLPVLAHFAVAVFTELGSGWI